MQNSLLIEKAKDNIMAKRRSVMAYVPLSKSFLTQASPSKDALEIVESAHIKAEQDWEIFLTSGDMMPNTQTAAF